MRSDSLVQSAAAGIVAAVVAVVVVFFIADAASGPLMANDPSGELAEVAVGAAVVAVIIGGLVGTLIAFLVKNLSQAAQVFLGICAVGLVLYGIFALIQADDIATGVWLNVMHIAAAIPIVGMLTRWLQGRRAVAATT